MPFGGNKIVSFAVVTSCLLFILVLGIEKTKKIVNLVPMVRGEVSLGKDVVITTTRTQRPIIVKKDDVFYGNEMRFSGSINEMHSDIAYSICREGFTVVNVGAYFGYDAITLASKLEKNGKVYAFEDNRSIYNCLKKSVVLNEMDDRVIVKNLAISDKKGICEMEDYMSVYKKEDETFSAPSTFVAECNTLDNELKDVVQKIDMLLIDEAGYEFSIIRGAHDILANSPNVVIISDYERKYSARNVDVKAELDMLVNEGYFIYFVDKEGRTTEPNTSEIAAKDEGVLIISKNRMGKEQQSYAKMIQERQQQMARQ